MLRVQSPAMKDETGRLLRAARQLIETDELLGGQFVPAGSNPLPEIDPQRRGPAAMPNMTRRQKADALKDMDVNEVRNCPRCVLKDSRRQTVFGEGDPDADLVFVGEAPGAEEDATGRPFVGRAGELLTNMIRAMGLKRRDVFICNMLKCRPPHNRSPNPQEIECCWGFLVRQLQIIAPKVIVSLGNPATQGLLNTRTGITRLRGHWQKLPDIGEGLGGTDVMPTFHPAYLLRQYSDENRRKVWSDLQAVMKRLGLKPAKKGRESAKP